jgi:hypothetical protein
MSALQTTVGEDICHADVADAVKRVMIDAQRVGMAPDRHEGSFMLAYLAASVARFLNAHPEHRAELLPELDPGAGVAW